jgi:uncharacterized protein with FMN-binding domain
MARKMPRRMVAMSASAIATIYAAGFALTRSADTALGIAASASRVSTTAVAQAQTNPTPTVVVGASGATASASTATTSAYKDGTYSGQGTSRRGGIGVTVTVQGGVITNVQITSVNTEYPVSRIASLPSAVVKQQTASVNVISGATYSSQAFKQAVQQALSQAATTNA